MIDDGSYDALDKVASDIIKDGLAKYLMDADLSRLAFNLIGRLAVSDPDAAARWYGDIKTLADNHPKEAALRDPQSRAAANLIGRLAS